MDLEALETFLAVAELRHFAKAADRRHLSQPAVSRHVARLEHDLSVRLLNRTSRRVTLTVAGEALVEEGRRVLADLDRARQRVQEIATGVTGRVRLGASVTPGLYLLPPLLARYQADHPTFTLVFEIGRVQDIADRVARNELDLAFISGRPATSGLRALPLVDDDLVAVAAPVDPVARETARFARGRPGRARATTPESLAGRVWILREEGSDTRRLAQAWLERHRVVPRHTMTLDGPDAVKRAVMAGLGLAIASRLTVADELRASRLVELALPGLPERRALHLIDHPRKHHGAACRAMIELLRASLVRNGTA
jgi:DNA-binding transcriptional LysR family regulator